jgi:hypothetical protein
VLRVASWIFVVCTLASALGVFVPAVGLRDAGPLAKRTSLSLYRAATDRDVVRRLVVGYNRSAGKRVGAEIVAILEPHAGHFKDYVDDAHDAMDTIGGVTDDDARHAATIFAITIWAFLLIHAVMAALVLRESVDGRYRRRPLVAAMALAVLAAAVAVAILLGCRAAVWEANDELGHDVLAVAGGAYVIAIASIGRLAAGIALVVAPRRRSAA